MKHDLLNYLNSTILKEASKLSYIVKDNAPSTELELFNESSLIIWSGASENTIYNDFRVNYAFRALHDDLHLKTGLNFSIDCEVELGRIQANMFNSSIIQDIIYLEVAGQALFYKKYNSFVQNQNEFILNELKKGVKI